MKSKIFDNIAQQLEKHISQFGESVDTFDTNADIDENETIDMDERSQQDEATDMKQRLERPLEALEHALLQLKSYKKGEESIEAGTGSIVETKESYYVLGIALPPMDLEGKKVLGVSAAAPFYPSIEGKKKGERLKLGDDEQEILNVY